MKRAFAQKILLRSKMVATKHCCWGKYNNDPRYPETLPDSLKEMLKNGQKAFIPFPKPKHNLEPCQRWLNACSRQTFFVKNVNCNTYIGAVHWPGGKGPTKESPDPFKANLSGDSIRPNGGMMEWRNGMAEHTEYS